LADLGNTLENQRKLVEPNKECSADIPERGAFYTWDEYERQRIDVDSFDPRGVILALDVDRWLGMCALPHQPGADWVLVEMTGVVRPHRRRGLSLALKAYALPLANAVRSNVRFLGVLARDAVEPALSDTRLYFTCEDRHLTAGFHIRSSHEASR